jgi:hypothetical protein
MTRELVQAGYEVIGYGANEAALADIAHQFGIRTAGRIEDVGIVDAVVACTHSAAVKLSPADVDLLRRDGRKLLVIDVAEPANLDIDAYAECRDRVVRQDAGNAYADALHYVLGPISWRMLILSRGVVFGCFAEAITLHHAIFTRGRAELADRDWFVIDAVHTALVAAIFAEIGFVVPAPRCFGETVHGFDLALRADDAAQAPLLGISTPNVLPLPGVERMASR